MGEQSDEERALDICATVLSWSRRTGEAALCAKGEVRKHLAEVRLEAEAERDQWKERAQRLERERTPMIAAATIAEHWLEYAADNAVYPPTTDASLRRAAYDLSTALKALAGEDEG